MINQPGGDAHPLGELRFQSIKELKPNECRKILKHEKGLVDKLVFFGKGTPEELQERVKKLGYPKANSGQGLVSEGSNVDPISHLRSKPINELKFLECQKILSYEKSLSEQFFKLKKVDPEILRQRVMNLGYPKARPAQGVVGDGIAKEKDEMKKVEEDAGAVDKKVVNNVTASPPVEVVAVASATDGDEKKEDSSSAPIEAVAVAVASATDGDEKKEFKVSIMTYNMQHFFALVVWFCVVDLEGFLMFFCEGIGSHMFQGLFRDHHHERQQA